jgi:16S rRNA (guanine527-N7)-methyltransferase
LANAEAEQYAARLNDLLCKAGLEQLDPGVAQLFSSYLSLLARWNSKTNLTAVRDPEEILSRHFVECIACAVALPAGINTLLDVGSGAGLPGIPIALCRSEIAVTLAESQGKKAAFLQEAVRTLGLNMRVHAGRAEQLTSSFDCVILRAVDRMAEAVRASAPLVAPTGWLAIMTTCADLPDLQRAAGERYSWEENLPLPNSDSRILALGHQPISPKMFHMEH